MRQYLHLTSEVKSTPQIISHFLPNRSLNSLCSTIHPPDPDEPTNFLATPIDSTSISLTWGPPRDPNGIIISYHLDASVGGQDSYILTTGLENIMDPLGGSDLMSYTLTGLHPYVLYQFRLSASTSAGMGNATEVKEAMTEQAGSSLCVYMCLYWYIVFILSS